MLQAKDRGVNSFHPGKLTRLLPRFLIHLVLLVISLVFVLPVIVVISTSLSSEQDISVFGYAIVPRNFTTFAYQYIFADPNQIIKAYFVTITVTVVGTVLGLLIMSLLAYGLSRKDFTFRKPLSFFVFFTMLFNGGLVPWYILITQYLHLKNTIWVLILPYLVVPWFVLLLRTFFSAIPAELIEAARIDGSGEWRTFFRIVMPLSTPALATVGLFIMLQYWNDWWLALLFIDDPNLVPVQLLLYNLEANINYLASSPLSVGVSIPVESVRMAMAALAIGPIVFAFLFTQRYFIRGIALGGLKG